MKYDIIYKFCTLIVQLILMKPAKSTDTSKANKPTQNPTTVTYNADRVIGNGSFGVVYQVSIHIGT